MPAQSPGGGPDRHRLPGAIWAWFSRAGIGATALLAQWTPAQDAAAVDATGPGWIDARHEPFRERFQQLLLAAPTRDLGQGWQLAAEIGRPVAPLLWDMVQAERAQTGRRLAVLAAAMVAGGAAEDERSLAWLDRPKGMVEDRVLTALWLAHGPRRARPVPNLAGRLLGGGRPPEPVLRLAVRLASARFPGGEAGDAVGADEDPGLAAAGVFAGLPIGAAVAARYGNLKASERHVELYWRAGLLAGARGLAEGRPPEVEWLQRARDLSAWPGEAFAAVRCAALLYRLRAQDQVADGPRPDWRLLHQAVVDRAAAVAVRGWLTAAPQPRDEEPARLAVAYVLSREPAEVVAEQAVWSAAPRVRRHVAIALAWRLLGEPPAAPIELDLPGVPEWVFVRLAGGARPAVPVLDDAPLQLAARLAAADRLPPAALRAALEDALWRWGSHPGLGAWEQERLLLRDLLLVGSLVGGGRYVPHVRPEQRYRASGIAPDDVFYEVASSLHDFLVRPRLPIPAECRLR
ncbi:MAG: hypothetical protein KF830_17840 [Planctomycetes bacterium]|nr:hypothetical protein [Planctomycetota bacterium]